MNRSFLCDCETVTVVKLPVTLGTGPFLKTVNVCLPVISDAVEKSIAMVHHGSHSPENCGVAHQTGREHEVTATTTAHTDRIK